jgi:hypothetical protein
MTVPSHDRHPSGAEGGSDYSTSAQPGEANTAIRPGVCDVCDLQWEWSTPVETVAVIMAIPSRFMSALEAHPVRRIDESFVPIRETSGWSALQHAAHVAEVLHATAKRLHLVFEQARTELTPPHVEAPLANLNSMSVPVLRAALSSAAADVARTVNEARPEQWTLTARQGDHTVSAESLLADAVVHAHEHLHDLRRMLNEPVNGPPTAAARDHPSVITVETCASDPERPTVSGRADWMALVSATTSANPAFDRDQGTRTPSRRPQHVEPAVAVGADHEGWS